MSNLRKLYNRLPSFLKNKYFLTLTTFAAWMLFFDDNNFYSQFKLRHELSELRDKKEFYKKEITQVKSDMHDLFTDQKTLEKFAREKYWMKRDNEDLFIIVEK
ncbi:MAG: septum formation initiator family protein [Verrucomicrobia bacterium]|nr:septum formation initiator family protein [Verrucomicrobiota bacterium]